MCKDVHTMNYRKKKKIGLWFAGIFCLTFLFYGFRSLQRYLIYAQLKAKLRPFEYVVYLGNFNSESFLHDTSQNVQEPVPVLPPTGLYDTNIPLGRQLPDTRPELCKSSFMRSNLPSTSVVIVYKDETKSVLLRTIYSILLRSPPDLLEEVILVDDASKDVSTGLELAKIPKIKVIRNPHFEGLVRSFNIGSSHALAPVLTFTSANCEVNIGWLEPLLNQVAHNKNSVAVPRLDKISSKTLEYEVSEIANTARGGFDWSMTFKWEKTSGGPTISSAVRTPIYPGHVLSIRRERFISLGKFDPLMEQYGGENFELSFKSWMCGGSVDIVPCSRVGQLNLEAEVLGKPWGNENIYNKNIRRVAEVWMDDYKRFFYHTKPSARMLQIGGVMERRALRSHLKCRTFKWYLNNVYKEISPPVTDELMYGCIQQNNLCIDIEIGHVPAVAKLRTCNSDRDTQEWSWKRGGEITNGGMCLSSDAIETHGYVMVHFCTNDNSQKWKYLNGLIYRVGTSQCIDSHKAEVGLVISDCDELYPSQKWTISSQQGESGNKDEV